MQWTDERIDQWLGTLLRSGVILSAVVVLIGGLIFVYKYGTNQPNYEIFHGEPEVLRNVPGILGNAWTLHSRGLIQLGLLLLIGTPIARVLFSVVAFALQRDHTYVLITLIVLAILLYSLFSISP
ncbi:MAG: DUF1634 domain-containing protein [Caldilineaceae bacterium]